MVKIKSKSLIGLRATKTRYCRATILVERVNVRQKPLSGAVYSK